MKNPNPHDGYAPDLFSEHARAAQLGLRVLDILKDYGPCEAARWPSTQALSFHVLVHSAAVALGVTEDSDKARANRETFAKCAGVRAADLLWWVYDPPGYYSAPAFDQGDGSCCEVKP